MELLNDDMFNLIFKLLDYRSLMSIKKTCKRFNELKIEEEKIKNSRDLYEILKKEKLSYEIIKQFENKLFFIEDIYDEFIRHDEIKNEFNKNIYLIKLYDKIKNHQYDNKCIFDGSIIYGENDLLSLLPDNQFFYFYSLFDYIKQTIKCGNVFKWHGGIGNFIGKKWIILF